MLTQLIVEGAFLLVLFGASAFFSLSETALIGVRRWQVRQLAEAGSARAKAVDRMLNDPERILSTVLVGNTIVNISAAALGTVIGAQVFPQFHTLLATVAVTIVILILCELVPKTLAVQNALAFSLRTARPLAIVEALMGPVISLAGGAAKLILRPLGIKPLRKAPYITSDEIEMLVRVGVEQGEVERFEQRVISDLFDFTETMVRRVMTPADGVAHVPATATLKDAVEIANRTGRTRLPITDGDFDHVLGFVHVKDLLRFGSGEGGQRPVRSLLRGCMTVSADMGADRVLQQMQREHRMLAVVQDHGHNVGLVTAEDLVEELVGELHDEFDAMRARGAKTHGADAAA
ncbi:MAG: hemolysin family protein [Thermoplasmatota archaeon]